MSESGGLTAEFQWSHGSSRVDHVICVCFVKVRLPGCGFREAEAQVCERGPGEEYEVGGLSLGGALELMAVEGRNSDE